MWLGFHVSELCAGLRERNGKKNLSFLTWFNCVDDDDKCKHITILFP